MRGWMDAPIADLSSRDLIAAGCMRQEDDYTVRLWHIME